MSLQDAGPSRKPKINLPQPAKFSGEGDDLKPDRLKRWFREVKKYLSKHEVDDETEDVVDYYGPFTEDRAHNAYLTPLDEYDKASPTLEQFGPDSNSFSKPLPTPMTSIRNGRRYNRQLEEIQHAYQR